jgi:hypothetical protein
MHVKQVLSVMGLKSPQKPKTVDYSSRKRLKNVKNDKFLVMPLKHVLSVMGHVNPPKPQNCGQ